MLKLGLIDLIKKLIEERRDKEELKNFREAFSRQHKPKRSQHHDNQQRR